VVALGTGKVCPAKKGHDFPDTVIADTGCGTARNNNPIKNIDNMSSFLVFRFIFFLLTKRLFSFMV
jgi:hypothetical protein